MTNRPLRPSILTLLESLAAVVAASLAIRLLPFGRLARALGPSPSPNVAPLAISQPLGRAIAFWSKLLPWRTKCFEQAVAAHWLLRRRNFRSVVIFGARPQADSILAHVWVRSGEHDVIGCENVDSFVVLSHFTNVSSSSTVHRSLCKTGGEES